MTKDGVEDDYCFLESDEMMACVFFWMFRVFRFLIIWIVSYFLIFFNNLCDFDNLYMFKKEKIKTWKRGVYRKVNRANERPSNDVQIQHSKSMLTATITTSTNSKSDVKHLIFTYFNLFPLNLDYRFLW